MNKLIHGAVTIILLSTPVRAQVFDVPFGNFRASLDKIIEADTTDKENKDGGVIRKCQAKKDSYVCVFNEKSFSNSVAAMKKLDIISGSFNQKLKVTVETKNKKVSRILLNGDRGDPANLFLFYGTVMDIMQVFDSTAVDNDTKLKRLSSELGLMRGDNASDIGEEKVVIKPYALIKCMAVPSSITTGEACEWTPRS